MMIKKILFILAYIPMTFGNICYTIDDIENSNTLFVWRDDVYDTTGYKHPAGSSTLKKTIGKDLDIFLEQSKYAFHLKSSGFYRDMDEMFVGPLSEICETTTQPATSCIPNPSGCATYTTKVFTSIPEPTTEKTEKTEKTEETESTKKTKPPKTTEIPSDETKSTEFSTYNPSTTSNPLTSIFTSSAIDSSSSTDSSIPPSSTDPSTSVSSSESSSRTSIKATDSILTTTEAIVNSCPANNILDYQVYIPIVLLVLSEILPFVPVQFNGILDMIIRILSKLTQTPSSVQRNVVVSATTTNAPA
jgi:hypothetical protein